MCLKKMGFPLDFFEKMWYNYQGMELLQSS